MTIALCVETGAVDFMPIADWAAMNMESFCKFFNLCSGIPSHESFNEIFATPNSTKFGKCPLIWTTALHDVTGVNVIAIEGNRLRRSFDKVSSKAAIPMVGALAMTNHVYLG